MPIVYLSSCKFFFKDKSLSSLTNYLRWLNFKQITSFSVFKSKVCSSMSRLLHPKPPNVAIYTGSVKNSDEQFKRCKEILTRLLAVDRYVFFHLNDLQVINEPWQNNVELLVVTNQTLNDDVEKCFQNFLFKEGKILCTPLTIKNNRYRLVDVQPANCAFNMFHQEFGNWTYPHSDILRLVEDDKHFDGEAIVKISNTNEIVMGELKAKGKLIFSQVSLYDLRIEETTPMKQVLINILRDRFLLDCSSNELVNSVPSITPCCLFTENEEDLQSFRKLLTNQLNANDDHLTLNVESQLEFLGSFKLVTPIHDNLNLAVYRNSQQNSRFDYYNYFSNLKTSKLGKIVIYNEVISSTMDVINSLRFSEAVVAIARKQISGKGRGGHVWLSPDGCAMFSLKLAIPLASNVGHHLTFMQHLVALAMVEGVKSIPRLQDLDIKIKWPNDVYFKSDIKIGGLLVQTLIDGNTLLFSIGCGLNVNNGNPTTCLNDIIKETFKQELGVPTVKIDQVISHIITKLEELINELQQNGISSILPLYYSNWLHSNAEVKIVTCEGIKKEAKILGVDDYGFLQVQLLADDSVTLSVQPDGNSFDMLHNLVILKSST